MPDLYDKECNRFESFGYFPLFITCSLYFILVFSLCHQSYNYYVTFYLYFIYLTIFSIIKLFAHSKPNIAFFAAIPLSFTIPLEDVTVEQDEKVTLQCELSKPNQKVTWLKNGKALSFKEKNRLKITADGAKHTLVIPKADLDDTAEFTCSLNGVKTQGKVTVKGSKVLNLSSCQFHCSMFINHSVLSPC